ncbi:MAG: hypothetical protein EBV76_07610, partial [Gammaproteobacteria bacterium]|nr:hypothetical protein [Gammaproteobacteria bacterium]
LPGALAPNLRTRTSRQRVRKSGPAARAVSMGSLPKPSCRSSSRIRAGPDFLTLCREVRVRKFGARAPGSWAEKGKQARFLQYRGFSSDHIRLAMGQDPDSSENPADDYD